ncbi:MAG: acyltransferase [Bacteroidales bacterium]|nr:acyltransferase [Bacteroidales bacterium]
MALEIFRLQSDGNRVYSDYLDALGFDRNSVKATENIPFLPISLFKTREVKTGVFSPEIIFTSSGTTGSENSRHFVKQLSLYERSFIKGFNRFYGDPAEYSIIALLPSYIGNEGSSLIYMVNNLAACSPDRSGGFFSEHLNMLPGKLKLLKEEGRKVILIGVTYALLDMAEKYPADLSGIIVMETGGMKGRRREMVREEVHGILKSAFNCDAIHSEYGMTELMSQAWSEGNGLFHTPPWMKILIRDPLDPVDYLENGRTGGINIIDLANIYSCSFIETSDLGRKTDEHTFEVTGRFDNSDIRGCNLLTL